MNEKEVLKLASGLRAAFAKCRKGDSIAIRMHWKIGGNDEDERIDYVPAKDLIEVFDAFKKAWNHRAYLLKNIADALACKTHMRRIEMKNIRDAAEYEGKLATKEQILMLCDDWDTLQGTRVLLRQMLEKLAGTK